jgi:hypothetical protein
MLLNFDNDDPFATGMAAYRYVTVPGGDDTLRILIQVEVDDDLKEAILDTGGQYFFCTPELAKSLSASPKESLVDRTIHLKGKDVHGSLCRIDLTLLSDEGGPLLFQVTAFLPDAGQDFTPAFLPYSYLGLHGCMERVRFAIDPSQGEDRFYFGECSASQGPPNLMAHRE